MIVKNEPNGDGSDSMWLQPASSASSTNGTGNRKPLTTTAKLLIGTSGGIALGLTVVCASFLAPALRRFCLPYVPATGEQIRNILKLLPVEAKGRLLDIGSGDGRIVMAVAEHCPQLISEGVELNPWLVWFSRGKTLLWNNSTRRTRIRFHRKDLWQFDMKSYNYIVIFGVEAMMKDLELKLLAESKCQGKRVIACRFPLPNLKPISTIGHGIDTVWLYDLKSNNSSSNNNNHCGSSIPH